MKFVVLGGQRGIVEDITLSLHDRHRHIDSIYTTITGKDDFYAYKYHNFVLKFRHYEKATKFEKIFHLF